MNFGSKIFSDDLDASTMCVLFTNLSHGRSRTVLSTVV